MTRARTKSSSSISPRRNEVEGLPLDRATYVARSLTFPREDRHSRVFTVVNSGSIHDDQRSTTATSVVLELRTAGCQTFSAFSLQHPN